MKFTESLFPLSVVVCASLGGGCILTTNGEDDGNQDGESGSASFDDDDASDPSVDDGDDSGDGPTSVDGTDDASDDDPTDDSTTGPSGDCTENLAMDPGFEAGSPSTAWAETSTTFGTPICNADCTDDANAGPYEGEFWAWFGGLAEPEAASLTQSITIPAGDTALLSFRFAVNAAAGTGDDVFTVTVDGTSVFMATDAEMDDYADYTHVEVDVTQFADGAAHTVRFESDFPGNDEGLITNFFLDKVSVLSCNATGTDSGDSGSSDGSTAADDTSTGTGDSGSTDAGSSDSGDSSGSSSST